MYKTSISRKIFVVFNYAIMILSSVVCVVPFWHLFVVSLSGKTAVSAGAVTLWPVDFTLTAYEYAIEGGQFLRAVSNSIVLVVVGTTVSLFMTLITAYPLSKPNEELLGRDIYVWYFMITTLIGGGMIPTYLVIVNMGLRNSIWALIIPGCVSVGNVLLMMNFIRGLPKELPEAARMDGATEITIVGRILMPLLKPSIATIGLFNMMGYWNNWFSPMIYYNDYHQYPLATYLQKLLVNFDTIIASAGDDYAEIISRLNAQTGRASQLFLGALPVMIVYPFLQKHFTKGMVVGSVKG